MADHWKGEWDKASWEGRYAETMISAGATHAEAWEAAAIAWDLAEDDDDPEGAASAEIAYSMEG